MSCINTNPKFSPEVFALILSKLDDLSALLNCRLVCRSWNAECLSLLRKSRFRKTIGPSDLEEAAQFGARAGQFIIPFQLHHSNYRMLPLEETEEEFEDKCVAEFQTMSQNIPQLLANCGRDCVREYYTSYVPCGARGLVAFNKFLALISHHLTKFDVHFCASASLSRRETVQILRNAPALFPNLKELMCESTSNQGHVDYEDQVERENIESVLIENSHNLEQLTLMTDDCANACSYWPTQTPAALRTLKILDVDELRYRARFLDNIRASPFQPILETFRFSTEQVLGRGQDEEMAGLAGALECFSKTLKSVSVYLGPKSEINTEARPLRFPRLPRLEHLDLAFKTIHYPCFVDPLEFNFAQATFPILHHVEIPFGCMLATPPPRPHTAEHVFVPAAAAIFPSVRNLTLTVDKCTFHEEDCLVLQRGRRSITWEDYCEGYCEPSCDEHKLETTGVRYVDFVAQQFPRVTNLAVCSRGVAGEEAPASADVENVIDAILQSESDWPVEEFLVGHTYLRRVLGAEHFANRLTDVRKIKFVDFCKASNFVDLLHFNLLAQHFPKIEQIEISKGLLGGNQAERLQLLRLAQAINPDWNIKLI